MLTDKQNLIVSSGVGYMMTAGAGWSFANDFTTWTIGFLLAWGVFMTAAWYDRNNGLTAKLHTGNLPDYDYGVADPRATEIVMHALINDIRFREEFHGRMTMGGKWMGPAAAISWLVSPDKKDKTAVRVSNNLLRHAIGQIDGDYLVRNWFKIVPPTIGGKV